VAPRLPHVSANHSSPRLSIVFTAVQLLLLGKGTDRLTPNMENNTKPKRRCTKRDFIGGWVAGR
jgi:hypothetical protein